MTDNLPSVGATVTDDRGVEWEIVSYCYDDHGEITHAICRVLDTPVDADDVREWQSARE